MNQHEIEWAAKQQHHCPNVRKGCTLLLRLVEAVNEQSDGWAYWSAPSKAAQKLIDLLSSTGNLNYGTSGSITPAELRKAIVPIRTMVTRQKTVQAECGNTFNFDVDAALMQ